MLKTQKTVINNNSLSYRVWIYNLYMHLTINKYVPKYSNVR